MALPSDVRSVNAGNPILLAGSPTRSSDPAWLSQLALQLTYSAVKIGKSERACWQCWLRKGKGKGRHIDRARRQQQRDLLNQLWAQTQHSQDQKGGIHRKFCLAKINLL
ncbi:Hypothetical protein NTJ_02012 [Nesidiocoris tenuis]|uniref:Uncharacterized protein n=1 Tax=Nesidiocoris tenuis TaxID=355587 RepID=A0ABN7AA53_9HEMI|nr:Hypothetical protein NTJ_02012 [Nesidiocoris tenuis]